ncbi:MAG TPA: preprotein translocase subunit SecY [Phycisphaerales bacterium]|nr:preprotein translocase subunit SecY [Phycisphaerales bacterium]
MFNALQNVFKIPELRNKILFTLAMLAVFRIGHWIPLPGIDHEALAKVMGAVTQDSESPVGRAINAVSMFSGGTLSHSTIFGLGVMPYITASIVFQLLMTVSPRLKKLQEEGPTGRQKITEWTRYATIFLCFVQGFGWIKTIQASPEQLIYAQWVTNPMWWIMAILALTAGTMFLMWIGEQIDKYGIGNGVSMIIMTGILTGMPGAVAQVVKDYDPATPGKLGMPGVALLIAGFVAVVGGSVLLTVAQRRIPVQLAKHQTRGRSVIQGERSFLPLRLNHSGVMPVVFASSLMIFPGILFNLLSGATTAPGTPGWLSWMGPIATWLNDNFAMGNFPYVMGEVALIYFFSYFWITVQFNPEDMSKQLRDSGSFIPGLRPGPRTAEYLEAVMSRITFVGAAALALIAVLPMVVAERFNVQPNVSQFLGGTGLLIVVSVVLDFVQRVEANLLMRNYQGFLGGTGDKGPRLRSRMG